MENLNYIIKFVQYFGLATNVTAESSHIVLFMLVLLFFSLMAMLCIINICIYLLILYFSNNTYVLNIVSKHKYLLKIFNFYRKTRVYYIVIEFAFLIVNVSCIIYFCCRMINGLS